MGSCINSYGAQFPRVLTARQLTDELDKGSRLFINTVVTDRWTGMALASVTNAQVTFQNCYFASGIEFHDLKVSVPLSFDSCVFGRFPATKSDLTTEALNRLAFDRSFLSSLFKPGTPDEKTDPTDNLIQSCYFSDSIRFRRCTFFWHTRINDTVFSSLFTVESSSYSERFHVEASSFISRFKISNTNFDRGAILEKVDFGSSLDVGESDFFEILELQKTHISGDLILESSAIKGRAVAGSSGKGMLRMIDTIVAGELNADHLSFDDSSKLIIQECTIADVRGLNWGEFHRVFESADLRNEAEVLALVRRSFLQFGQTADAGEAFLAIKANEADSGGWVALPVDCVMRYTSGWGTRPSLLLGWFLGIVLLFMGWYLVLVTRLCGYGQLHSHLTECFVLSVSVTLLQNDPDDIRELSGGVAGLQEKLRKVIRWQKIIATLFLMVIAAYIGSTLSGQ